MAETYSISSGITYAETFEDFNALLQSLPDNVQRLISPRDVRDSIFTTWESTVFKLSKISTGQTYIGIDQEKFKSKVYFGKKVWFGNSVMSADLLNDPNVDFYLYNGKLDNIEEQNTRIAILAGTDFNFKNSSNQLGAPQIEAAVVTSPNSNKYIDLNIFNTSHVLEDTKRIGGNINIKSEVSNVSINDFYFPTSVEHTKETNNGKYLQLIFDGSKAYGTWSGAEDGVGGGPGGGGSFVTNITNNNGEVVRGIFATQVFYNNPNVSTNIYGSLGKQAFNNVSLHEILTKMLYSIIEPSHSVAFTRKPYIESGDTVTKNEQRFSYSYTRNDRAYFFTSYTIDGLPYVGDIPAPTLVFTQQSGNVDPTFDDLVLNTQTNKYQIVREYSMTGNLTENRNGVVTVRPLTDKFKLVIPHFVILGPVVSLNTTTFNQLLAAASTKGTSFWYAPASGAYTHKVFKFVQEQPSSFQVRLNTADMTDGRACLYVAYPSEYQDLTGMINSLNFDYMGAPASMTKNIITGVQSPQNFWGGGDQNREFKVYQLTPQSSGGIARASTFNNELHTFKFG